MSERPSFYITTAIHYPNGAPHIGHAYETFGTDALARFKRHDGFDVFFLTGVDEHGLKMMQTAAKEGISPAELGDRNTALFREMTDRFNCHYTDYIRTTEPRHKRSCQEIWRRMADAGDIYSDTYAGWYSVRDEAYYAESETTLNSDSVRVGPQGTPVEWTEEETYFFKLSKYQDRLLDYYDANPDFIAPESRRNEVISFVKGGLLDLSISRTTFDWGIPVPDVDGHIMYVWVDALTNYITGVGFPDTESQNYQTYWPADVHIIGKDILRFHAVYWPAFLLSAGLAPPKRVYAHGMIFNRGEKLSKSTGNVIDTASFADNYGVDQLRYFFLREVPFGQDGNYSHESIVNRINADLANDFGNLAQRSLSMIHKNCAGTVPDPGPFSDADKTLLAAADGMLDAAREAFDRQAMSRGIEAIWAIVGDANRYFAGEAPWALKKTDPDRMGTVLYVTAEVVRQVAILAQPVMPESCARMLDQLSIAATDRDFCHLGESGRIAPGSKIEKPQPIFPRYVAPEGDTAPTGGAS